MGVHLIIGISKGTWRGGWIGKVRTLPIDPPHQHLQYTAPNSSCPHSPSLAGVTRADSVLTAVPLPAHAGRKSGKRRHNSTVWYFGKEEVSKDLTVQKCVECKIYFSINFSSTTFNSAFVLTDIFWKMMISAVWQWMEHWLNEFFILMSKCSKSLSWRSPNGWWAKCSHFSKFKAILSSASCYLQSGIHHAKPCCVEEPDPVYQERPIGKEKIRSVSLTADA